MSDEKFKLLFEVFLDYSDSIENDFVEQIEKWPSSLEESVVYRIMGAQLARQVHFTLSISTNPGLWNGHTAPLILRPMLETYLKMAWALQSPLSRCNGIARADLLGAISRLKQLKQEAEKNESAEASTTLLDSMNDLFEQELALFDDQEKAILIESREMARKAGEQALTMYRNYQVKFSSAVHSTWNHISRFNLNYDPNPLHRFQLVAMFPEIGANFMHAFCAADLCDHTFRLIFESEEPRQPLSKLLGDLEKIGAISRESSFSTRFQ